MGMSLQIITADLANPVHQAAIVELLDLYAQDVMGNGKPLPEDVKQTLPERLQAMPTCHVWLAYDGELPVGIVVAFLGFSTFQAKPLLNLHDVAVRPGYRGGGVGKQMLAAVEAGAWELGCCKLTLEVHGENAVARQVYLKYGFQVGQPPHEFLTKQLTPLPGVTP
jgi:GNAT superfamily N-acetyltransferase